MKLRFGVKKRRQCGLKRNEQFTILFLLISFLTLSFTVVVQSNLPIPIVQTEEELTNTWLVFTKLDVESSNDFEVYFSNIDELLFYWNYRISSGQKGEESVLREVSEWIRSSEEGNEAFGWIRNMNQKKSGMDAKQLEELIALKEEIGYQMLDGQLHSPTKEKKISIVRRFGHEIGEVFRGIQIAVTTNEDIFAPMRGVVKAMNKEEVQIENENYRLRLQGVELDLTFWKEKEECEQGKKIGTTSGKTLSLFYEKKAENNPSWTTVNPSFYFQQTEFLQKTWKKSVDFQPLNDVEERATSVYRYFRNRGFPSEGICAILGNFHIESAINPKRAEGDYLNPPVGATLSSWDDDSWLNMGNDEIYHGKYPLILHRGLGLGQWTDTRDGSIRQTMLREFAKRKGKKWYDLELQLDFMQNGDTPWSRTVLQATLENPLKKSVEDLTLYFLQKWEGNPGDKVNQRTASAKNWFQYFKTQDVSGKDLSGEEIETYKKQCLPLPTEKELKIGWSGNAYALGNCTWYVYNRMRQFGKVLYPYMGNANQWVTNYKKTNGAVLADFPKKRDVVIFTNGVAGSSSLYGHVAVVEFVFSDGSFLISEMNVSGIYSTRWRVIRREFGEYFLRIQER